MAPSVHPSVVLKNAAGTALTNGTYTLTVGATDLTTVSTAGETLTYTKSTGVWALGGGNGIPVGVITSDGTYNVDVTTSVSNGQGGTVTRTDVSSAELTILPTAPTINAVAWAATGAGNTSALSGVAEGLYGTFSTFASSVQVTDNILYNSEVIGNGTVVRVQLPTTATVPTKVGDTVLLNWGTAPAISHTVVLADLTAKYVDFTVSEADIRSQGFGNVNVTSKIVSTSGTTSTTATQVVDFEFDLPLVLPASTSSPSYGFVINGAGPQATTNAVNNEWSASGGSVINVGDMNGDGYDDVLVADSDNFKAFVVYGHAGNAKVDTSTIAAGGSTAGFLINALTNYYGFYNWGVASTDINGDGLNDIMLTMNPTGAADVRQSQVAVIYGQSTGTTIQLSSLTSTPSLGYWIKDTYIYGDTDGDRRADFKRHFVGFQLNNRLIDGHLGADRHQPTSDSGFANRFAQRGNLNFRSHEFFSHFFFLGSGGPGGPSDGFQAGAAQT
jgi:hypothetical protein